MIKNKDGKDGRKESEGKEGREGKRREINTNIRNGKERKREGRK